MDKICKPDPAKKNPRIGMLKEEEKKIYELSNGQRSTREIEKLVNASRSKIASLWKKWYKIGIVESSDKYGGTRMKRLSLTFRSWNCDQNTY